MRAEVRDDIIALDKFVAARFKYEKYIDALHEAGGYCFLDQFEQLWKDDGGKYLAKKLEGAGLIKTLSYSNYKFAMLTDVALKYLTYKDSEKDFSNVSKNMISVKKLKTEPSEKVLFFSAMKFHLIQKYEHLKKSIFIEENRRKLEIFLGSKNKEIEELASKIQLLEKELLELKDTYSLYLKDIDIVTNIEYLNRQVKELETRIMVLEDEKNNSLFKSKKEKETSELQSQKRMIELKISAFQDVNSKILAFKKNYNSKNKERENLYLELQNLQINQNEIDKKVENALKKILNLHDRSKIFLLVNTNVAAKLGVTFIITDTSTGLKSGKKYFELLDEFLKEIDAEVRLSAKLVVLQLVFVSFQYEKRLREFNDIYKYINNQIKKVCEFEVIRDNVYIYYMYDYKKRASNDISYIKKKDLENFEKLRETLNSKK